MDKLIFFFILLVVVLGAAFWVGRQSVMPKQEIVTARIILDSIQDQAFLVTKTVYTTQETTLTRADTKGFKGLFTGDELQARALVRTDAGVDLKRLTESDIRVDAAKKQISVTLPGAEILTSGITGTVEIQTTRGLWTSIRELFTEENGKDYNRAVEALTQNAEAAVRTKTEIFDSARADTVKLIQWLVAHIAPTYQVEVVR